MLTLVSLQQGNVKKSKKSMKIVSMEGENLHIFWMTWWILMTFSEKMWPMIILKVIKNQDFTLSLENTLLDHIEVNFMANFLGLI